ncbi:unnamed protein product [Prorocentrum cordatum]|uniref:Helicase C-terminal domain-containing protein n=1 Tax=Prorocentrum cordatum TaxID=2364126 RepID=A0ABN9V117_9DINO|nr:unnamed protein product [Polarella glacialis]
MLHIAGSEGPGAVLVFVPGWAEITDCVKELEGAQHRSGERWHIFPLHSMVPPHEQNQIFQVFPEGSRQRKIIVSTNIAETSITVEDVVFVIDSGLIKGTTYAPKTNVATLEALQISRSNGQQRRGRAGRVRPGKFFKLYSRIDWDEMSDSMEPEMQRTPVEELCLQVRALDLPGRIGAVLGRAIDPPEKLAVSNAIFLLRSLGALDAEEQLTPLGWKLALLPIHPSLGKMMLLGSLLDCVPELLSVCATLSSKSPFVMPFGKEKEADAAKQALGQGLSSDHLLYARAVASWLRMGPRDRSSFCFDYFLSDKALQQIDKTRRDLHQYVVDLKLRPAGEKLPPGDDSLGPERCAELQFALASSLPLATRPPSQRKFRCLEATHASCAVHPSSLLEHMSSPKRRSWEGEGAYGVLCWFSRLKTAELYLHDASLVADVLPLVLLSPFVAPREGHPAVFEVAAPPMGDDADDEGEGPAADGADSMGGGSLGESAPPPPPLLLKLGDAALAGPVWELRGKLGELVDRIIGQPPAKLPQEAAAAFHALRGLLHASYQLHAAEPEACEEFGGDPSQEEPQPQGQRGGGWRSGGRGRGGGGGGYPWWQHVRGKGKGRGW